MNVFAALFLFCTSAWAEDDPDLDELMEELDEGRPSEPAPLRRSGIAVGLGASVLAGGNAQAYSPGVSTQVEFEYNTGRWIQYYLGMEVGWNSLTDARPYFPDHNVTAGVIVGSQSFLCPETGFRFGVHLKGAREEGFRAWPSLRVGLGLAVVPTTITLPTFEGSLIYTAYSYAPYLSVGLGAEMRFRENMSLIPEVRASLMGYRDGPEVEKASAQWGVEARVVPTVGFKVIL